MKSMKSVRPFWASYFDSKGPIDAPSRVAKYQALFTAKKRSVRMGTAPIRIEILNDIDGVDFDECMPRAELRTLSGTNVRVIGLEDLKANKRASGRPKDLDDLLHLP